ncbi:hypothetical protein [Actinorhabdospora filicis]|nr:hypothetical protein [Actinorhabdospora filicis]
MWHTTGGGHTITIGRTGSDSGWDVEHTSLHAQTTLTCTSESAARILADRLRATVPGRCWWEHEAT